MRLESILKRFDESVKMVKDAGLRYSVNRFLIWCDFGFLVNNRMYDFDKVIINSLGLRI